MFGYMVALKKRKSEAAASHFTWEEREAMEQKVDAIDATEVNAAEAITQCALEIAAAT
jgi:hypothetical protein